MTAHTNNITKTELKNGRTSWGYYVLTGKDAAGKRVQVTKQGFKTRGKALDALREAIRKRDATPAAGDLRTFSEYFDYWVREQAARRCAPKTVERYRELGVYAKRHFGETPVVKLTPLEIENAVNALHKCGGQKSATHPDGKPLSAKTVRHIGFLINDAFEDAVRLGVLTVNPMARVKLPKVVKRKVTVLDEVSVSKWFEGASRTSLYAPIVLAAATGCRRGELLALQWTDIDFATGLMTVNKSLEETKAGLRVKEH